MPTAADGVTREHIEAYLVELLDLGRAPATVSNRFRALQQFWKFLVDEGDITASPMARMTRPRVPEQPIAVLSEDHLRALLSTCSGRSFEDVRDAAIIRLFVDTGMRRAELLRLRVDHLDLDQDVAVVAGKGGRHRACPFGAKTGQVLDRYMRARNRHKNAAAPELHAPVTAQSSDPSESKSLGLRTAGKRAALTTAICLAQLPVGSCAKAFPTERA
jgi:site-specific recombinase XerD